MSIARHFGLAAPLAGCFFLASTLASVARAQSSEGEPTKAERASARDAYDKGTVAFQKGNYVTALDSFVKANALIPSVQAMYWIAQAQDKLGHTDAAIEAYEAITARADFSKLSEDKASTVRARLAALKPPPPAAPPPVPAPPPVVEPDPAAPAPAPVAEPPVVNAPPPNVNEPPALPVAAEPLPERNTLELGVFGGPLFVSDANNFVAPSKKNTNFDAPTWQLGARAAFFPEKVFGIEAEYAHGFGWWGCDEGQKCAPVVGSKYSGGVARFDSVRGHLIGQWPTSRIVPFALLGAGLIHSKSYKSGTDNDFAFVLGAGMKVMATKLLVPRIDFRLNMTQKQGGGFTDGVATHPEILLGLGFTLGR